MELHRDLLISWNIFISNFSFISNVVAIRTKWEMVEFKDLPPSPKMAILEQTFKSNLFDAGNGCVLMESFREITEQVQNFKVRSDDVFLCSFPRTGSTWLQEILWLLGNDLDFETAQTSVQQLRCSLLELSGLYPEENHPAGEWVKWECH